MKNKRKIPVWVLITTLMIACACISATVTTYVAKIAVQQAVCETITGIKTETGQYPDWFTEWLNRVYIKEHTEE